MREGNKPAYKKGRYCGPWMERIKYGRKTQAIKNPANLRGFVGVDGLEPPTLCL